MIWIIIAPFVIIMGLVAIATVIGSIQHWKDVKFSVREGKIICNNKET